MTQLSPHPHQSDHNYLLHPAITSPVHYSLLQLTTFCPDFPSGGGEMSDVITTTCLPPGPGNIDPRIEPDYWLARSTEPGCHISLCHHIRQQRGLQYSIINTPQSTVTVKTAYVSWPYYPDTHSAAGLRWLYHLSCRDILILYNSELQHYHQQQREKHQHGHDNSLINKELVDGHGVVNNNRWPFLTLSICKIFEDDMYVISHNDISLAFASEMARNVFYF